MSQELIFILIALPILSLVMVWAMIPFTMELIEPSRDFRQHRRRLRKFGGGGLTEQLLPRFLEVGTPARVWGALYVLTWFGLLVIFGELISGSAPADLTNNVLVVTLIVGAWWTVQITVVVIGRALKRLNARPRQTDAASPAEKRAAEQPTEPELTMPATAANSADASGSGGWFGSAWGWLVPVALVAVVVLGNGLADQHPIRDVDDFFHQRQTLLLGVTITIAVTGFIAFMGGIMWMVFARGSPMSREDVEHQHEQMMLDQNSRIGGAARYRISGETVGAQAEDAWSMAEMKNAWNAGLWRSVPLWRRRFLTTAGALAAMCGAAGLVIVLAPPGVKLLVVGCVAYATVRTVAAFRRAGRS